MAEAGRVHLDLSDDVALLTIDRPSRRNAMDLAVWEGIRDRATAAAEAGARALVLTGAGPHFSSGLDLKPDNPLAMDAMGVVFGGGREAGEALIRRLKACLAPLRTFPGLSIAAIEGVCLGGAFEAALHCDVRIAGRGAVFSLPEARYGMVPDVGGTTLLTRLVGPGRAAMIVASGRQYMADEAYGLGMLEMVVAPGGALSAARALAEDVRRSAPTATREAVSLARRAPGLGLDAALDAETAAGARALVSGEVAEGLQSFVEKRAPSWSPDSTKPAGAAG